MDLGKLLCLTNLLEFIEDVLSRVDHGEAVDVIFLDFSQAFDKDFSQALIII